MLFRSPNLLRQWQFELKTKFNETFSVINTDTVKYLRNTQRHDGNPFAEYDSVLVSERWITGKDAKSGKTGDQYARLLIVLPEGGDAELEAFMRDRTTTKSAKG